MLAFTSLNLYSRQPTSQNIAVPHAPLHYESRIEMSLEMNEVEDFCPNIESCVSHTGFKRNPPDARDLERVYGAPPIASAASLPVVDLRKYFHQVYDQGKLGNCSANVICATYELELKKEAQLYSFDYRHCALLFARPMNLGFQHFSAMSSLLQH